MPAVVRGSSEVGLGADSCSGLRAGRRMRSGGARKFLEPRVPLACGDLAEVDEEDRVSLVQLAHRAVDGVVVECGPAQQSPGSVKAGDARAFGVALVGDDHDAVGVRKRALSLLVGIAGEAAGALATARSPSSAAGRRGRSVPGLRFLSRAARRLAVMSVAAVLLVDDDAPIRRMLERSLSAEGYEVATAADGGSALAQVERSMPDVIVLDVAMPGLDGLAVTRRLRSKGLNVPILLLTARDALHQRVEGLDAGADDYLVKPFEVEELTARIRALLRRNQPPGEQLGHADLVLERETLEARRGGRTLTLTRREAELLELLMLNARGVVTRELALERVWGDGEATANVVDRYVAYLRRKLGDPPLIHTVRGVGFRLE